MDTVPHTYSVFNYVSLGAVGYFTVGMFSFFIYSVDISIISEYVSEVKRKANCNIVDRSK